MASLTVRVHWPAKAKISAEAGHESLLLPLLVRRRALAGATTQPEPTHDALASAFGVAGLVDINRGKLMPNSILESRSLSRMQTCLSIL